MNNEQNNNIVDQHRSTVPHDDHFVTAQNQQIKNTFIRLGRGVPGVFYEPVTLTEKSQIAILVMHSDGDYLTFSTGTEMAKRGFRVLCANVRDKDNSLDRKILDVKLAVEYLQKCSGVKKVVLMGHSGGATLMSAYQNLAENGVKAFQGSQKIVKCSDDLVNLPLADGAMMLDSNWGNAAMMLFSLDPAVMSEDSGQSLNPELNLFNPANGFKPEGSTYSDDFILKFQKAQGKRNNQLIQNALDRLQAIDSGEGNYSDDEPFIIPGAAQGFMNNKLFAQDVRLMSHTQKAWPLLHADGSMTTQVVYSVRGPENKESFTGSYYEGALRITVRNFLTSYAVRTTDNYGYNEDSVKGIDWSSSYNCTSGNIMGVSVPLLVMGMTGNWEYLAAETIYENAESIDKTLVFVEGASHLFTTATQCEKYPGQFGDTQKTTYDYVDKWLSQMGRFLD